MRQTKKLIAARAMLEKVATVETYSDDEAYELLESMDYLWNSREGKWEKKVLKPSIFDDVSAGFVRIRVMAHPERIDEAVTQVSSYFPEVQEVSNQYPNRDDVGVRVYLLVKLGN